MSPPLSAGAKKLGNSGAVSQKPTTFHSFALMPAELRTMVWEFAIPGRRVIQVQSWLVVSEDESQLLGMEFASSMPVPAILHTSFESRVIALQYYELAIAGQIQSEPRIYVDYNRDTIYFGEKDNYDEGFTLSLMALYVSQRDLSKIRNLGMSSVLWNVNMLFNGRVLIQFPSVKKLTLTMERSSVATTKNVKFVTPKEAEWTTTVIEDEEMSDQEGEEIFWPYEMEEIVTGMVGEPYYEDDDDKEMPDIAFKMLTGRDESASGKTAKK